MDSVATLLLALLLFAGYLIIVQMIVHQSDGRIAVLPLAITALFVYLCAVGFIGLLYFYFGHDDLIIYIALCLFAAACLAYVIRDCVKHRASISIVHLLLFIAVCCVIAYVTIGMRIGSESGGVCMQPFVRLISAVETGDPTEVTHDLLNIALFIPVGLLIPLMNRRRFRPIGYSFIFALVVSTTIESIQYVAHLGQCDINDILSNTVGAVIGHMLTLFYLQVKRNWRL